MNDDWLGSAIAAAQGGDEAAFGRIVERFGPELKVHCYRMLASLDDAEDTVQDVFLQAWRGLRDFEGRASVRTWLYRIATNACLANRSRTRRRRRLLTEDAARGAVPIVMSVPWLQACPEDLIDRVAASEPDPASLLVARETIELAFIAALQHLPERQRAILVLRDVIGWSAERCATELRLTLPSVNSALQRIRGALRQRLGGVREQWPSQHDATDVERVLVGRYVDAVEAGDDAAIAALLQEDVLVMHQPGASGNQSDLPIWYGGKATVIQAWAPALHGPQPLHMRLMESWANRQPGLASYIGLPGSAEQRAFGLTLLRIEHQRITEITNLTPNQFDSLGLPRMLQSTG
jgi:RNA polymerase sigma-70 factor, ECF subfamily